MANIIRIKRGTGIAGTTGKLLAGELALDTATGVLYTALVDGGDSVEIKGAASGTVTNAENATYATAADKLKVARNIAISGDVTGSASFDGSEDIEIAVALAKTGVTAGTYTKVTIDDEGRVITGAAVTKEDLPTIVITDIEGLETALNNKVDKVSGKQLSTEDYTTAEKEKLASLVNYDDSELTELVNTKADKTALNAYTTTEGMNTLLNNKADKDSVYTKEEINTTLAGYATDAELKTVSDNLGTANTTLEGKADKATTLAGYGITDAYTKTEVNGMVAGAFTFKGTKNSLEELNALTEKEAGDVYQVGEKEYAYNGTAWVELGFNIDLSAYAKSADVAATYATIENLNKKANSTDVYTKTEADAAFMSSTEVESAITAKGYATTAAMNTALSSKANSADVYTKTEADAEFLKEVPSTYVTETELSSALASYITTSTTIDGGTF